MPDKYWSSESVSNRTEVIILGGGQGARLFPLTQERSKPAVPLAGKFRLIDLPLSNCLHSGLKRIYILTQFNSDSLHRHIAQTYRFDFFSKGFVQILAAQQTPENQNWYQGTADAVRHSLRRLSHRNPEHIVILSGDHLYRMDYRDLLRTHVNNNADLTISVLPVERSKCSEFGILQADENGQIVSFEEKPKEAEQLERLKVSPKAFEPFNIDPKGREHIASMGVYIFKTKSMIEALRDNPGTDFGKEIIPSLIGNKRVFAHFFDGYWEDIGTIRSFYNANLALTKPIPEFNFYDEDAPVYSRPRFLPCVKFNQATVRSSLIGDGAIISGAVIEKSVVGLRSVIADNAQLYNTIMMGADFYDSYATRQLENVRGDAPSLGVGQRSMIQNAILDKNVRIGEDVRILNQEHATESDGANYYIRDGIVIIPRSAVIPNGTVI